jgi:hypothetical protein
MSDVILPMEDDHLVSLLEQTFSHIEDINPQGERTEPRDITSFWLYATLQYLYEKQGFDPNSFPQVMGDVIGRIAAGNPEGAFAQAVYALVEQAKVSYRQAMPQ